MDYLRHHKLLSHQQHGMMLVYKMLFGFVYLNSDEYFSLRADSAIRKHKYKLLVKLLLQVKYIETFFPLRK